MLLPWILVIAVLLAAIIGFAVYGRRRARGYEPPRPDVRPERGEEARGRV